MSRAEPRGPQGLRCSRQGGGDPRGANLSAKFPQLLLHADFHAQVGPPLSFPWACGNFSRFYDLFFWWQIFEDASEILAFFIDCLRKFCFFFVLVFWCRLNEDKRSDFSVAFVFNQSVNSTCFFIIVVRKQWNWSKSINPNQHQVSWMGI